MKYYIIAGEPSGDLHGANLMKGLRKSDPEAEFRGWRVPDVLLSGNFAEIEKWQEEQSFERTKRLRPDLLERMK